MAVLEGLMAVLMRVSPPSPGIRSCASWTPVLYSKLLYLWDLGVLLESEVREVCSELFVLVFCPLFVRAQVACPRFETHIFTNGKSTVELSLLPVVRACSDHGTR